MSLTPEEVLKVYQEADCLHDRQQVEAAIQQLGEAITQRLAEQNPLVLCVMTGAVIPAGLLLMELDFPLEIDYIHATRYRGETAGGELHWQARPQSPVADRVVLVIDDILDEGLTLEAIVEELRRQGAREVLTAVLVEKLRSRSCPLKADFVGIEVVDRYLFGYGMDYKGYLRNAPGIFAVKGM